MKRFLIAGNKGQLGKEFEKILKSQGEDTIGFDIEDFDITDIDDLKNCFETIKPTVVLNCTAYNHVDNAELDENPAYKANVIGVKNLAQLSADYNCFLVHFSTDYVFDGKKHSPYIEADSPNPLSKYGRSKLLGEMALADILTDFLIFRVSWLYGDGNQNFIYKFLSWCKSNNELKVSDNEISVPTYTYDVVQIALQSVKLGLNGLYHLTNSSYCSRYDWAKEIVRLTNLTNTVIPVQKEQFNLPAVRPDFSAMSNELISETLFIQIPDWKNALSRYMQRFNI